MTNPPGHLWRDKWTAPKWTTLKNLTEPGELPDTTEAGRASNHSRPAEGLFLNVLQWHALLFYLNWSRCSRLEGVQRAPPPLKLRRSEKQDYKSPSASLERNPDGVAVAGQPGLLDADAPVLEDTFLHIAVLKAHTISTRITLILVQNLNQRHVKR